MWIQTTEDTERFEDFFSPLWPNVPWNSWKNSSAVEDDRFQASPKALRLLVLVELQVQVGADLEAKFAGSRDVMKQVGLIFK